MDTISPTLERARHAGEAFEPIRVDKQVGSTKPARILPRWDIMERAGKITTEQADAGRTYERHMELASRATVTPSYGQRSAEGTPSSQLDDSAFQERAAAWVDYYALHRAASVAIGPRSVDYLWRFLRGEPLHVLGATGPTRKGVAIQRATAKLIMILTQLGEHYGQRRRRDPYP